MPRRAKKGGKRSRRVEKRREKKEKVENENKKEKEKGVENSEKVKMGRIASVAIVASVASVANVAVVAIVAGAVRFFSCVVFVTNKKGKTLLTEHQTEEQHQRHGIVELKQQRAQRSQIASLAMAQTPFKELPKHPNVHAEQQITRYSERQRLRHGRRRETEHVQHEKHQHSVIERGSEHICVHIPPIFPRSEVFKPRNNEHAEIALVSALSIVPTFSSR